MSAILSVYMDFAPKHILRIISRSDICKGGVACRYCCFIYNGYRPRPITYYPSRTYRSSYKYFYGRDIPVDKQINHHCDDGLCWQPSHLYLGTPHRNFIDQRFKGWAIGLLSDKDLIRALKCMAAANWPVKEVCKELDLPVYIIFRLIRYGMHRNELHEYEGLH